MSEKKQYKPAVQNTTKVETPVETPVVETVTEAVETVTTVVAPHVVEQPVVEVKAVEEPAPVVKPKPVVQNTAPAPLKISNFAETVETIKKSGTVHQKTLVSNLESYIAEMQPGKPIPAEAGARAQYRLWKTIHVLAHGSLEEEFKSLWSLLLRYFEEYKDGVFHDRYVFRFSEFWSQSVDELNAFQRTLNLIKLTADPKGRQNGLRQVNLNATLAQGYNEDGRRRVLNFYS